MTRTRAIRTTKEHPAERTTKIAAKGKAFIQNEPLLPRIMTPAQHNALHWPPQTEAFYKTYLKA